jgi:hypothetical protein
MLDNLQTHSSPVMREVAAPVCEALLEHRRGQHARVVALMAPVLGRLRELGGSHAQRDVLVQIFSDSSRRSQRVAA